MLNPDIITKKIRGRIMVSLFAVFFILAPVIILYTAGYRYNWRLQRIEQTGVISVDALPTDATVYINGIKITKSIPLRMEGLAPGTYSLEIKKPGYKSWRKNIAVESQQSTYIKNIVLFRESFPILMVKDSDGDLKSIYPSFDGHYILIVFHHSGMYDLHLLDTATMHHTSIARYALSTPPVIAWSQVSNIAMLQIHGSDGVVVQLMAAATGELSPPYTFTKAEAARWQWSKGHVPVLYIEHDATIQKLALQHKTTLTAIIPSSTLWYVDDSEHVWLLNTSKKNIYKDSEVKQPVALPTERPLRIIDVNPHRIILGTINGLFIHRNTASLDEQENFVATAVRYNSATGEWLAWSPSELWSIYDNGHTVLLNRSSKYATDVWPIDEYGVVLLAARTSLTAFNPGYYVSQELWSDNSSNQPVAAIEQTGVNRDGNQVYFLGTVGKVRGLFVLDF